MKYYAVKVGKKTGIFNTWEECKEQVEGFEGAVYKSFSKLEDANDFLLEQQQLHLEVDGPIAYVDGSFKEETNEYSFGVVLLINGKEYHFKKSFPSDELHSVTRPLSMLFLRDMQRHMHISTMAHGITSMTTSLSLRVMVRSRSDASTIRRI